MFSLTYHGLSYYAPINVNPEGGGGGGRAKGGDLMNQVVPWVGIWTDTFFLCGPRVGIFDRLTLISDDILKKPEPIFEQTEDWALVHRSLSRCFYKKYGDFWTRNKHL